MTVAYRAYLAAYDNHETRLQGMMNALHGPRLSACLYMYHIQLKAYYWFEQASSHVATGGLPPPPSFDSGLMRLREERNLNWLPNFNDVIQLKALVRAAPRGPPAGRGGGGDGVPGPDRPPRGGRVVN